MRSKRRCMSKNLVSQPLSSWGHLLQDAEVRSLADTIRRALPDASRLYSDEYLPSTNPSKGPFPSDFISLLRNCVIGQSYRFAEKRLTRARGLMTDVSRPRDFERSGARDKQRCDELSTWPNIRFLVSILSRDVFVITAESRNDELK